MTDQETPPTLITPNARNSPATALGVLLRELWRYKFVVPTVAVLVIAGVAFWTMRQTRIYEAVATLEYDPHPVQPLGSAVEDPNLSGAYWGTQEFYETQNFILKSRSLAERVVRQLRLHQDRDFMRTGGTEGPAPTSNASVANATSLLMEAVKVEQVRDTRVVSIRARDSSPDRAQRIANALAEAYIDKSLEDRLGSSARALEWLGEQMQGLKRELEASELALYKFREQHHTLSASLDDRQRIIASQLQRYSDAFTDIHGRRVQVEARLSVLREILSSDQDLLSLDVKPIGDDQVVAGLRESYRRASEELGRLSVLYGDAHPQVRAAQGAREYALTQLKTQVRAIYAGIEAELTELERAEKGVQAALDQVNDQGLKLSLQEIDYTRLDRERNSKVELYDVVMERAAQTDLTRAMRVATGRLVDPAVRPTIAVSPRVRMILIFGGIIGLALGVAAALGVAFLDNKIRGPADMEARGVTLLGVLPALGSAPVMPSYSRDKKRRGRRIENKDRDLIVHLEPRSTAAECCRTIRTNITFQSADHPLRTIAITSAMPKDGKTTVSISLATILAQSGRRVLLVDTDLRKPRLHRAFQIPTGPGITTVLAGEATIDEVVQTTDVPGLMLMQCGPLPPNPSELLHTRRFAEIVEQAKNSFDTVIFDSPPLGAVTDPAIISTQV
ncbi:MAG: Tyrosine-protein kinase EpsD, partial [Myxococcaceae bacterium]|nr:Tyrosine-protein kinase EpsD [Myxococcaceae bacterium]